MEHWRAGLGLIASLGFCGLGVVIAVMDRAALEIAAGTMLFFGGCAAVFLGELLVKPRSPPPTPDGPVLLAPDRRRLLAPLLGALGLAASLPFLWRMGLGEGVWGAALVGLGALLSLFAAAVTLFRLIRPRPLYQFNAEGVAGLGGRGWRLAWAEIDGFTAYNLQGQGFLGLRTRAAAPRTVGAAANEALGFPGYSIPVSATGLALDDLEALAKACQARWAGRAGAPGAAQRGPRRPPE